VRLLQCLLAKRGDQYLLVVTLKYLKTELFFHFRQSCAERRLGNGTTLGCLLKMQGTFNRQGVMDLFQRNHVASITGSAYIFTFLERNYQNV
jgi:hypothetical protein